MLGIYELDKGISSGTEEEGTSKRLLGTLLTWMAENQHSVFIVATANQIDVLPPELIRKGRLDEIFFVDLPDAPVRKQIFQIHLDKRDIPLSGIDLPRIVDASDGFSGAEIGQAVVSALYASHSNDAQLDTDSLLQEISQTRPLSIVMAEQIQQLRYWAGQRTVPVD